MLEKGIVQDRDSMRNLISLAVLQGIIEPEKRARDRDGHHLKVFKEDDDLNNMNWDLNKKNTNIRNDLRDFGMPIQMVFTEPSTGQNHEEIMENREFLCEYCFEYLNAQSVSF